MSASVSNCERRAAAFASGGRAEIDAMIAEGGVDGPLCINCGRRGLHLLALHSRNQLCEYLLKELAADPNVTDKKGRTPLHYASGRLNRVCMGTVHLLLENGAKAAVLDDANQAPIDRALLVESIDTAELLLQAEPDWSVRHFGQRDSEGRTIMHSCVERELNDSVLFLLRHSVSLYECDFQEVCPLDLMLESNNLLLLHRIFQFKLARVFRRGDDPQATCGVSNDAAAAPRSATGSPKVQACQLRSVFELLSMIDNTSRSFLLIVQELRRLGLAPKHHAGETARQAFSIKALEECINEQNLKKFLDLMRQMPEFCLNKKLMEGENGQKFLELFIKKAYIEENFELMQILMHVMGDVTPVDITQRIEKDFLYPLYCECEDNGQGVWTYVREHLDFESEATFWRSLQGFLACLTGIETVEPDAGLCQISQFKIFRNPMRTYVVWTVVTGKYQRSFLSLCMRQFDAIPLGLYAIKILRSLSQLSTITTGVREGLQERADAMEQLLKAALQEIFINDRSRRKAVTCDFIRFKLLPFGNHSVVSLAAVAKCGNFLSLACCQDALDKDWFGGYFECVSPDRMRTPACVAKRQLLMALALLPPLNVVAFYAVVKLERPRHSRRNRRRGEEATAVAAAKKPADGDEMLDAASQTLAQEMQHQHKHFRNGGMDEAASTLDQLTPPPQYSAVDDDPPSISGSRNNLKRPRRDRTSYDGGSGIQGLLDDLRCEEADSESDSSDLRLALSRLALFLESPAVKFQYHLMSHLTLLALLTGTVLFHFHSRLNHMETTIAVWFLGMVVEEASECRSCKSPMTYLADMWNVMDLASIALFYLGFFTKLTLDVIIGERVDRLSCVPDFVDSRYYWIRVLYCLCLFLLYCRLMFYAVIFKALGPKIRMICKMLVTDLLPFLVVLGIFMAAFGVSLQSLLYPNGFYQPKPDQNVTCADLHGSQMQMQRVWLNLIEKAFYITVGEFFVEELKGLACEGSGCPHEIGRVLVPTALNFLFILVTNVLLLNLLIALFSKTVDQIHGNSTSVWYYSRHYTMEEFQRRLSLPPPLNLLQAAVLLVRRLRPLRCFRNTKLARQRATILRRQRGARRESEVLKFIYFLAVQAVTLRSKRADLFLGLVRSGRKRRFVELADSSAAAEAKSTACSAQQQQQLQTAKAVEDKLARLDGQMREMRAMLEQLLAVTNAQRPQPPPAQNAPSTAGDDASVRSNSFYQSAMDVSG